MPRRPPAPRPVRQRLRRGRPPERQRVADGDFSARVESAVRSVLQFFGSLARILATMLVSPRHFDRRADAQGRLAPSVAPYSFLTLSTFAATNAIRVLVTTALLALLALARSCEAETQRELRGPHASDYLRLPSIDDVLAVGVPAVLLILLVLAAMVRLLARRGPGAMPRLYSLSMYIVGWQYLLGALSVVVLLPGYFFRDTWGREALFDEQYYGLLLPIVVLLWPAAMLWSQLLKAVTPSARAWRQHPRIAQGLLGLLALVVCLLTMLAGIVVAYPLARYDSAAMMQPRPVLELLALDAQLSAEPGARIRLLVRNRSDETVYLMPEVAAIELRPVSGRAKSHPAHVADWQGRDAGVPALRPDESRWLELSVDEGSMLPKALRAGYSWTKSPAYTNAPEPESALAWLTELILPDLSYPVPANARGRACFLQLRTDGRLRSVHAFIRRAE